MILGLRTKAAGFRRDEDGGMLIFGLLMMVLMLAVGGIAVDVANAYQARTHLQVAADSAAHAALLARQTESADDARAIAVDVARTALPPEHFGDAIKATDIQFGYWDAAAEVFTADPASRDAVMVETSRLGERANAEITYFLRFVGRLNWDIRSQAVFETYYPTCFREGFLAEDIVEVTSNNHYKNGFCIHSNTYVDLNNNSTFETGVIVSMPDKRDINGPSSMFDNNPGLEASLRDGSYKIRILQRIQAIIDGVQDMSSEYFPDYITTTTPIVLPKKAKLDDTMFVKGRIHVINCSTSNQHDTIHRNTALRELVIVTNCKLKFGQGVSLEDVVVVNTNDTDDSFSAASGVRLGRNDNCAEGGGAQLVTLGGVKVPSSLEMYGSQILARGDVSFTANANGIEGASIVSGGRIDGTANGVAAFCDGIGMEDNFEAAYFRLAH